MLLFSSTSTLCANNLPAGRPLHRNPSAFVNHIEGSFLPNRTHKCFPAPDRHIRLSCQRRLRKCRHSRQPVPEAKRPKPLELTEPREVAVIRNRNSRSRNAADDLAFFIQHRAVGIDAADIRAAVVANNAVGIDFADHGTGIVKHRSRRHNFADVFAAFVNHHTVGINLITSVFVLLGG